MDIFDRKLEEDKQQLENSGDER